ncbi:MAG: ABC transporter ATP-binding protein [Anaerolineales bacterium]|nr:ABC transporter ATP-binding protein [Anaerolineales bacterium]
MTAAEFIHPEARTYDRSGPVRWIFSHAKIHAWLILMMIVGASGNAALAAAVPVLFGRAFDLVVEGQAEVAGLGGIALLIVGSQVLRGLLQFGRNYGAELMAQRLERDVRDELYLSLLGKSMAFHSLQAVGDTMARATNDVRQVNFMFSPGFNLVIGSGAFLLMPLIVAPSYHPALMLTPGLFIVFYFLALWHYLTELRPVTESVRQTFGDLNARLSEAIDGIEVIKGAAREREEMSRFSSNARAFRDAFVHQGRIEARYLPLLLLGLAIAGSFLHGMLLFRQGLLAAGDVVAYVGLINLFGFPVFASLYAYSQVSLGMAGARRILDMMEQKTELDRNPTGRDEPMNGRIEFDDASFAYPNAEPALRDVSFEVQPGQTVAIVGQTGAGKTTLAKLINRTHDVSSGQVLVDGVDVRDWDLDTLRRQISIIEQDVFLFSKTLAENIAFGKQDASQDEIEQAAKAAQAHEFIQTFEEGYESKVGERGATLSGGQRQRVALARAFLTDPRILILDDATSAIDSETEDQIQQAIFRAAEGRTTLLITHRLSQIRWADLIVVLRKGRVAAIGNHEELLRTAEPYRRIFTQYKD